MEDQALIAAYQDGEVEATRQVERWVAKAIATFRRPLGEDWEDAIQDVQIELLKAFDNDRFAGTGPLEAFVGRVARYRVIDRLRRRSRVAWVDIEAVTPWMEDPASLQRFEQASAVRDLLRRFATMPASCRQLWRMIVEGRSYREMSDALGVAEGTLRVRVRRCREQALLQRETASRDAVTSSTVASTEKAGRSSNESRTQ
ncbi:MAG: sigma-70 family RNA polymerase sigma factor [Thermoanaerobaculia bacterium]|nr:sigma-70 family RNA polymerase sigma factor [Thermoanaerobaculia bacterium]